MSIKNKIKKTITEEGVLALPKRTKNYLIFQVKKKTRRVLDYQNFSDILFVSGCTLPHPQRYRVEHQIEQLAAFGVSANMISYADLSIDMVKHHRGFVFYRCPQTPVVKKFIKVAQENNKTTFYDIDDLVFDTKYTKEIPYINQMNQKERSCYDNGVRRMGKTMKLCEYGITTTQRLANEMKKTLGEVYINRNVASNDMIKYSELALKKERDASKVIIGYFSGSMTHNDDFAMIMPILKDLLNKYDNLYLKVAGEIDIPADLKSVKDRIIIAPLVGWKELPKLIHSVDINIAPLRHTLFNEAKSENKWTEAALVKVPTVASDWGAFRETIKNGKTGILCKDEDEWRNSLTRLIENKAERTSLAEAAYHEVLERHITEKSGQGIAAFIQSKLRKNIAFVLPSTNMSGGIMVATKHAEILKMNGYDVFLLNACPNNNKDIKTDNGTKLFVISVNRNLSCLTIDTLVATMWVTLDYVKAFCRCRTKKYLVQGFEADFYKYGRTERIAATATYSQAEFVEYLTISKWCKDWLLSDFGQKAKFAPNGLDINYFNFKKRNFDKKKIRILIEGNSKDYYKNVDESFRIVEKLDKNKFEIVYLSYEGEPKPWYHVDKFYHKVAHDMVGEIYGSCDILLKTSILESFSYPPLEMMATGGLVVAVKNNGNQEYLEDGKNCLFYEQGNIENAVKKINRLVENEKLREKLITNGRKTAEGRDWQKIENLVLRLYK